MPTPRPENSVTRSAVEKPGSRISRNSSPSGMASRSRRSPLARARAMMRSRCEARAVVLHLDHDRPAFVPCVQVDAADGVLSGRAAHVGRLDAVVHGVAHEVRERIAQVLDDVRVHVHVFAREHQLRLFAARRSPRRARCGRTGGRWGRAAPSGSSSPLPADPGTGDRRRGAPRRRRPAGRSAGSGRAGRQALARHGDLAGEVHHPIELVDVHAQRLGSAEGVLQVHPAPADAGAPVVAPPARRRRASRRVGGARGRGPEPPHQIRGVPGPARRGPRARPVPGPSGRPRLRAARWPATVVSLKRARADADPARPRGHARTWRAPGSRARRRCP